MIHGGPPGLTCVSPRFTHARGASTIGARHDSDSVRAS
jgi:hypothetical protein